MELEVMNDTAIMSTKDQFLSHFELQDFSFDADFSKEIRSKAMAAIASMQFPTSKTEYWKYSRVNRLVKASYRIQTSDQELPATYWPQEASRIVLINGFFSEHYSSVNEEEGVIATSLSEAKNKHSVLMQQHFDRYARTDEDIFSAINTAYHQDGAFLHLSKNVQSHQPLHIINIITNDEVLCHPRNLLIAEQGSKGKVVIKTIKLNAKGTFTNILTEVSVASNANLTIDKWQEEGEAAAQIATEEVHQANDSQFKINTMTLSGDWVRNNLNIVSAGSNTTTWLNGLYLLRSNQHVDNHTMMDHTMPHCESHELYKGILTEKSTAVFNGKVFVRQDAQKTNAYQSNANILLSDDAKINSKPELEIYADDVKCSHGSTTGQLDEEALFYLRARGLSKVSARNLLINAFAADVLEQIESEELLTAVNVAIEATQNAGE